MAPALDALQTEVGDQVRIVKIDVDKNLDLAVRMKVLGVPTLMLYKNGELLWKDAGVQTKEQLLNVIKNAGLLSTGTPTL
jgi:thioredoxin 1